MHDNFIASVWKRSSLTYRCLQSLQRHLRHVVAHHTRTTEIPESGPPCLFLRIQKTMSDPADQSIDFVHLEHSCLIRHIFVLLLLFTNVEHLWCDVAYHLRFSKVAAPVAASIGGLELDVKRTL